MEVTLQPYSRQNWHWYILADGKKAGKVSIAHDLTDPDQTRWWLSIHVNQNLRSKGIGSVAYELACRASGLSEVYAHMRKSNPPSRKAAEKAGFVEIEMEHIKPQVAMVWKSA